jgi:CubicO group peptidase (beta-lactamase class C family)
LVVNQESEVKSNLDKMNWPKFIPYGLAVIFILILGFSLWNRNPPKASITTNPSVPFPPPILAKALLPEPTQDLIQECVKKSMAGGNCAGAVVLVAKNGRLLYHAAFGYAMITPEKRLMKPDTIFDMASLTKGLATAMSIMLLLEQGKLSLADRLDGLLPGFKGSREVRIRNLLTHTSGLTDEGIYDSGFTKFLRKVYAHTPAGFLQRFVGGYIKEPDVINGSLNSRPALEPGTHYLYQDINFILLGQVVKSVSGLPLDQFFAQNIAKPLGLKDTCFCPPPSKRHRIAATEKVNGTVLVGVVHDPRSRDLGGVAGHAGLFSTATETWRLAQTLLNGGAWGKKRLMSTATANLMTTIQSPPGLTPRGLGWEMDPVGQQSRGDLFPHDGFGHTGYTGTSLWVDKTSRTVLVILTNRVHPEDKGDVAMLRRRLANIVAAEVYRNGLSGTGAKSPAPPESQGGGL